MPRVYRYVLAPVAGAALALFVDRQTAREVGTPIRTSAWPGRRAGDDRGDRRAHAAHPRRGGGREPHASPGGQRPAVVILRAIVFAAVLASGCVAVGTGNASVERAYAQHLSNIEVTAEGTVARLLADNTGPSGTHQRFIVQVGGSTQTLLVDNNVEIGKRVPLAVGDEVTVHGEYVWNDQGGLVHFTHHDPVHTHEDGWIEVKGVRYS
jgi:hypothetical protein